MADAKLKLWEFADAPAALRDLIPMTYAGGLVIFVLPGGAVEIVDYLVARWTLMGFAVIRHERQDGSVVLAGTELPVKSLPPH